MSDHTDTLPASEALITSLSPMQTPVFTTHKSLIIPHNFSHFKISQQIQHLERRQRQTLLHFVSITRQLNYLQFKQSQELKQGVTLLYSFLIFPFIISILLGGFKCLFTLVMVQKRGYLTLSILQAFYEIKQFLFSKLILKVLLPAASTHSQQFIFSIGNIANS